MGFGLDEDDGDWGDEQAREHEREQKRAWRDARRNHKALKDQIKAELIKELNLPQPIKHQPRGQMVKCNCKECHTEFEARVADRKRGWGKFCSKSCAAKHKDRVNGGIYRGKYGT